MGHLAVVTVGGGGAVPRGRHRRPLRQEPWGGQWRSQPAHKPGPLALHSAPALVQKEIKRGEKEKEDGGFVGRLLRRGALFFYYKTTALSAGGHHMKRIGVRKSEDA